LNTPSALQKRRSRAPLTNKGLLFESHIQQTVVEFLELDGWRAFKMEAMSERGFVARVMARVRANKIVSQCAPLLEAIMRSCMRAAGVGETGMPDYQFVRYLAGAEIIVEPDSGGKIRAILKAPASEVLWIEFKRPGEKPRADQLAWHERERARGALVMVVGDSTGDWWGEFKEWYKTSGLQRR
jgi:hypothetical protein